MCRGLDRVSLQTFHCEYWTGIGCVLSLRACSENMPSPFAPFLLLRLPTRPLLPFPTLLDDPGACPNLAMNVAWCSTMISLRKRCLLYCLIIVHFKFNAALLCYYFSPFRKKKVVNRLPPPPPSPLYRLPPPPPQSTSSPPPPPLPIRLHEITDLDSCSLDVGKHGRSKSVHQHLGASRAF